MRVSLNTVGQAVVTTAVSAFLFLGSCSSRSGRDQAGVQVLMLAARHWGLNNFLMWDVFDRLGWQVTLTGVGDTVTACPYADESAGLHPILTDQRVDDLEGARGWDAVVLTPGAGNAYPVPDSYEDLVGSPAALALLQDSVRRDVPLYAMCSASRVLAAAGVIGGRRMVGAPRFAAEYGLACLATDGGSLVAGTTTSSGASSRDVLLVRLDGDGRDLWSRTWGGRGWEGATTLAETDGGFLVVGVTKHTVNGPSLYDNDLLLARLEADGRVRWQRTLGTPLADWASAVRPTPEGDAIVLGWTGGHGSGALDIRLTRIAVGP